jgi:hypothetical protein
MPSEHEQHLRAIEIVLLEISEAKERASRTRKRLSAEGAPEKFLAELALTEQALDEERRRLMQATYYSVPEDQERLAV